MKKIINISLLLALAVTTSSCFKNEEADIFEKQAADRLNDAIESYTNILTGEGGKWAMEYFASSDEPGYVYVMDFKNDGSVTITGDNQWINIETGQSYGSQSSLWEVIADNGPVLTFNTYNSLFHLFANPEDVPTTDTDENGYGHSGDYEFDLMRMNAAGDTLYLEGKKHGMSILMYRLPAETVNTEYFAKINDIIESTNITKFPDLVLHGADGYEYTVNDIATQVVTFYPKDGAWEYKPSRTVSGNAIATLQGFRFVQPVQLINNDGGETLRVQHFALQDDGSFLCTDDGISRITSLPVDTVFCDMSYAWHFDKDDLGGDFATIYQAVVDKSKSVLKRNFQYFAFLYDNRMKSFCLNFRNQSNYGNFAFEQIALGDNADEIKLVYTGESDANAKTHVNRIPEYQQFVDLLDGHTFKLTPTSAVNPSRIKFTDMANEANYFWIDVQ